MVMIAAHVPVAAQLVVTSSNLPIVKITTNNQVIVDDPKITVDMGIIDNGPGVRNNTEDPFNNFNGKVGIEIRGSSSQSFPKKQYGFELVDGTGKSIDGSILGMPAKDDWILFAPYNDKSLIRDALAYRLAHDMGRYSSRFKFCELFIDGGYKGVYVMLEKIKRDKNRVSIDKLDPDEISGDNLTGGYIFKIDKETGSGGDGWTSSHQPPRRSGNQTITELLTDNRLTLDLGKLVSNKTNTVDLFVGYRFWLNKFGTNPNPAGSAYVAGTRDSTLYLGISWHMF